MKVINIVAQSIATLTLLGSAMAGQPIKKPEAESKRVLIREEFGDFLNITPYSPTLGLAIPFGGATRLYEEHFDADSVLKRPNRKPELEEKIGKKFQKFADQSGGIFLSDYSKLNLGVMLGFEGDHGSAVLFRVRQKLQMLNEKVDAAEFRYVDDRKLDDSGNMLKAALMADFYLDPFYNDDWGSITGFVKSRYRFWFRLGVEFNRNDLPGTNEVDQQRFFGMLNFQANPDQDLNFLGVPGWQVTSPQIIQIGAIHERNLLSDEDSTHWVVGWAPLFNILDNGNGVWDGFGLNKRMYIGGPKNVEAPIAPVESKSNQADKVVVLSSTNKTDPHRDRFYTSINPGIKAFGKSDARGILSAAGKKLAGVRSKKDLEKLREEQLEWTLKALVGFDDGLFELSYTVTGVHPFSDFGDSHIAQEARLDVNLGKAMLKFTDSYENMGPNDWNNMHGYVSYKRGEFAPNYTDVDMLSVGVSTSF